MNVLVVFLCVLALPACSGVGGTPGGVGPTPLAPVLAPPPEGVSPEVWRVAFVVSTARLYRPDAVHIVLPSDTDDATRAVFTLAVSNVSRFIEGKTPIDLVEGPFGATFPVAVVPRLRCGGFDSVIACTSLAITSLGKVTGGKMEFASVEAMSMNIVMHEIFRTLGINGHSPVSGMMSLVPWQQPRPTDEEQKMLLGRYNYPLLSIYSAGL